MPEGRRATWPSSKRDEKEIKRIVFDILDRTTWHADKGRYVGGYIRPDEQTLLLKWVNEGKPQREEEIGIEEESTISSHPPATLPVEPHPEHD